VAGVSENILGVDVLKLATDIFVGIAVDLTFEFC